VNESRVQAGLTRAKNPTGTGRKGEKKAWAEREEERSGHDEIVAGEHETHRLGDQTVDEEEHEGVEEHGHLTGLPVSEGNLGSVGGENNTGAQSQKKSSGDRDFLGSKVGEHLIYTHIIFHEINKVVKCSTSHHLFMETVLIDDTPEISPDVMNFFDMFTFLTFLVRIMFVITKFDKVAKFPCMFNTGVV